MKAVLNKWTYIEEKVLIGSLIFNTLLIFLQIIMRGAFNSSLSWSEELSRYIFIWQIWLGADLAFAYGEHIKVEMIYNWLPGEKAKNMLRILVEAAWLAFNIFLVVKGAVVTAATLCAPIASKLGLNPILIFLASGAGARSCCHVNDSFFWVYTNCMGFDMKTGLRTLSISNVAMALGGLFATYIASLVL